MSVVYKSCIQADRARPYQICQKTVMDTSDPRIIFDEEGISNHYYEFLKERDEYVVAGEKGRLQLEGISKSIREHGAKRKYDCILGLSGGVDSTFLCLLAKELGLRPLVVHFDNGWNSELAVSNIENTVRKLDFDLFTYVVDWEEFRDLQRSYFKANVVDIEVLTDHGFMAVLYQQASKHKIKYVLGGMNVVTEAILPRDWIYKKGDLANILDIQSQYGTVPAKDLKSYPMLSPAKRRFIDRVLGMTVVSPLNYIEFVYDDVKKRIKDELSWRDYGGKHYESIFTRFYQGLILPSKFGIDKRRAHLSTLICSGQISRDEALAKLEISGYPDHQSEIDRPFVLKKLGFTESEFDDYLKSPRREHTEFRSDSKTSIYDRVPLLKPFRFIVNRLFPSK